MRKVAFVSIVGLVVFASGCDSTDDTVEFSATGTVPTNILVDPSYFMGDLPCAAAPGAMQSYVAHVYDVTNLLEPVALPASPPVSCSATVTFRQIAPGRGYTVKIDGYDVPASALVPFGGTGSGSRTMFLRDDPGAGQVTPRWTTACDPILAAESITRVADGCERLSLDPALTAISVDPRAGLASASPALACKDAGGDVDNFDVRPDNPALPPFFNVPCITGGVPPIVYGQGIMPGQTYGFRIEARGEAGGPVRWGAACFAMSKGGIQVDAVCDPLRADGTVEVSLSGLLGSLACPKDVATFDVVFAGSPGAEAKAVPCDKSVRFSGIEPGTHAASLVARDPAGNAALDATCPMIVVEPGLVTLATCTKL